jgi:hypothetical protein
VTERSGSLRQVWQAMNRASREVRVGSGRRPHDFRPSTTDLGEMRGRVRLVPMVLKSRESNGGDESRLCARKASAALENFVDRTLTFTSQDGLVRIADLQSVAARRSIYNKCPPEMAQAGSRASVLSLSPRENCFIFARVPARIDGRRRTAAASISIGAGGGRCRLS